MNAHYCLRCKTVSLTEIGPPDPRIRFFECPSCGRHYALNPGKQLTFRWLHPISLVLYNIKFDEAPIERAAGEALTFVEQDSPEELRFMVKEIRLELEDPTQQVRDMLDCKASERELRDYLRLFADYVQQLLAARRTQPEDGVGFHADDASEKILDPTVVRLLIEAVKQGYVNAAKALAVISDPSVVPLLIEAVKQGNVKVVEGLGILGKAASDAIPILLELESPESTIALGRIGDPVAIPTLVRRLKAADYWTRRYAAKALGEIRDPSAIPALLEALTSEEDLIVSYAAESLLMIGTSDAIKRMTPLVVKNLSHSPRSDADTHAINNSINIRSGAARILGKLKNPSFVHLLIPLLSQTWTVFQSAADALVQIGTRDAIEAVTPELLRRLDLEDDDSFNQKTAIRLLGKIGDPTFVPVLSPFLEVCDPVLVSLAKEALVQIGTADAHMLLKQAEKGGMS